MVSPRIAEHGGKIVKLMGDGLLAEFASVVEAVECAAEVQQDMVERNAGEPSGRRIEFRIGVNLGDVLVEDDDIFGEGVNRHLPGCVVLRTAAQRQNRRPHSHPAPSEIT